MPKQKTHKGAKKRFRVTKNGKVVCLSPGREQRMRNKSPKRRRQLRRTTPLTTTNANRIKRLLGMR